MTRVLDVDDEPQIRRALELNLRVRDYEVSSAASDEEALRLAATNHPDLIILDLGLPGIDGVEVIEGVRGWSDVPILILSARERQEAKVVALDAGADDHVTKPFGDRLSARPPGAHPSQARASPQASPVLRHRARHGIPVRSSAAERSVDAALERLRRPSRGRAGG